jgi:hypothetical protein
MVFGIHACRNHFDVFCDELPVTLGIQTGLGDVRKRPVKPYRPLRVLADLTEGGGELANLGAAAEFGLLQVEQMESMPDFLEPPRHVVASNHQEYEEESGQQAHYSD